MNVKVYSKMLNLCNSVDVLQWLYAEGHNQHYTVDKRKSVYDTLECIVKEYGTQFIYAESDAVVSSIINRIASTNHINNVIWNKVTLNLEDQYNDVWKLVFSDDTIVYSLNVEIDFSSLLVKNGDYYTFDFIYGNH